MKRTILLLLGAAMTFGSSPARGVDRAALEAEVRASEIAFAKTMADRDLEAFRKYVSIEAIFFGRAGALRGQAAVAEAWKRFYEGEKAPFSWAPDVVEVLESGSLALSSGPVHDPDGKVIGRFNSIWRREADGAWKVVFDKGCPVCEEPAPPEKKEQ